MKIRSQFIQGPVATIQVGGPVFWDDDGELVLKAQELLDAGALHLVVDLTQVWHVGAGGLLALLDLHRAWAERGGYGIRACMSNAWASPIARRWLDQSYGEIAPSVAAAVVSIWLDADASGGAWEEAA